MPDRAILVIRKKDRFSAILRQNGIEVTNLELIHTEPLADLSLLDEKIAELCQYDGLFFTSPAAADAFLKRGEDAILDFPGNFYVLGGRTKSAFEKSGLPVVYFDKANTGKELIEHIGTRALSGKRLLFVRGNRSMRTLPTSLNGIADLDEVVVYNTVENMLPDEKLAGIRDNLQNGFFEWICFFSPSGIESFNRYFAAESPPDTKIAAIGTTTAAAARNASMNVQFVSSKSDAEVFAESFISHIFHE